MVGHRGWVKCNGYALSCVGCSRAVGVLGGQCLPVGIIVGAQAIDETEQLDTTTLQPADISPARHNLLYSD
jgi:hypothetical protein